MKTISLLFITFMFSALSLVAKGTQSKLIPTEDKKFIAVSSLKTGDIIFTHGKGVQAEAVKAATHSVWTHTAIIFIENGKPMVLEAVQPVQFISLDRYLARGRGKYTHQVKRLINPAKLTPVAIRKAKTWAKKHIGGNYDGKFLWSDKNLYCSELVWKVYKNATGIELCKVRKVKDYKLKHPRVQSLIVARYGSIDRLKLNEKIVAPSDIYLSSLLINVQTTTLDTDVKSEVLYERLKVDK